MSGTAHPTSRPVAIRASERPDARPARSVYVHAPFCARRCSYCDFAVSVRRSADPGPWVEALAAELAWVETEGRIVPAPVLSTLYVGGGTPSLLGPEAMAGLAEVLGTARVSGADLEWTAEANPESFTEGVAGAWARAGVNRISLGAQTFHEPTLRWMGRLHGPDAPAEAVARARAAGVADVSVDLIFGLPASLGRSWSDDLEQVLALDVPHVSLYGLTVEPGTALGRAVAEGRERPVDDGRYAEEFLLAAERLVAAGYEHYEVSNFARGGARARHNAVYWSGEPYLGLGNGAHSYAHPLRRWNERDWERYRGTVVSGHAPLAGQETLDASSARLERIWLGLRTTDGLPIPSEPRAGTLVGRWIAEGLATVRGNRVCPTASGWLVLDRMAVDLDDACGVA